MVLSKIVIYLILFLLEICRIKVFGDVLAKGIVFLDCKNSDLTKSQKLLFPVLHREISFLDDKNID